MDGWTLTGAGRILSGIYHESDLLVAEVLRGGLLDDLDPVSLAGVLSGLTFEARREGEDAPPPRGALVVERLGLVESLAASLRSDERRVGLPRTRRPDGGLARSVVGWAGGATLDTVLRDAGDRPGRLRTKRPPADRPGPPDRPGGDRTGDPGGGCAGRRAPQAWGGRCRRPGGPGVRAPNACCRPSVIRACSPMPRNRSPSRRRTSSGGISPTSTSRCSRWSTCPRWSRGRCSPGTPGPRRACAACSWTSSWGSSTSPATPRSTPRSA